MIYTDTTPRPRRLTRKGAHDMIAARESALVGRRGMQKTISGLRWPAQVSASVPSSALSGSRLGRAFQGHSFGRLVSGAAAWKGLGEPGRADTQPSGEWWRADPYQALYSRVCVRPAPLTDLQRRTVRDSSEGQPSLPTRKAIRSLTPYPRHGATTPETTAGLVESARPGTTVKRGIRFPRKRGLDSSFIFPNGKWGGRHLILGGRA